MYGIEAKLEQADGKLKFAFLPEQYEHAHNTVLGKLKHMDDIYHYATQLAEQKKTPEFKARVPDGISGEVVFTTLTARAIPLVRYRTGHQSMFLPGLCPCGSVLRRLDRISGRIGAGVVLRNGMTITIQELDEALFAIDGVLNYKAEVTNGRVKDVLNLSFYVMSERKAEVPQLAVRALWNIEILRAAFEDDALSVGTVVLQGQDWLTTGVKKRKLVDKRRVFPFEWIQLNKQE